MTSIYSQIADRLRASVPALKTIDIDDAQLQAPDEAFPLVYPLALIDTDVVEWSNNGRKQQAGDMTVEVTVAVRLNHRTRQGNPDMGRLLEQLAVINDVNKALHGWGYQGLYVLTRIRTRTAKRADRIKQYVHIYRLQITDNTAMAPVTTTAAPSVDINASQP